MNADTQDTPLVHADQRPRSSTTLHVVIFLISSFFTFILIWCASVIHSIAAMIVYLVPACLTLWFGVSLLRKVFTQISPLRMGVFTIAFTFVSLLVFATPKIYCEGDLYFTQVEPLFSDARYLFTGINQPVLLAELLASIAIGAVTWSLVERKK